MVRSCRLRDGLFFNRPGVRHHETVGEADGQHPEAGEEAKLYVQASVAVHASHHAPILDDVR